MAFIRRVMTGGHGFADRGVCRRSSEESHSCRVGPDGVRDGGFIYARNSDRKRSTPNPGADNGDRAHVPEYTMQQLRSYS